MEKITQKSVSPIKLTDENNPRVAKLLKKLKKTLTNNPANAELLEIIDFEIKRNSSNLFEEPERNIRSSRRKLNPEQEPEPQPSTSKQISSNPLPELERNTRSSRRKLNPEQESEPQPSTSKQISHILTDHTQNDTHPFSHLFVCDICSVSITSKQSLKRHMKLYHSSQANPGPSKEKPNRKCYPCSRTFTDKDKFLDHNRKSHRNKGPFACKLCPKIYKKNSYLTDHMEITHNGRPKGGYFERSCYICCLIFRDINQFKIHSRQKGHPNSTNITCTYCDKISHTHTEHRRHASTKHSESPPDAQADEQYDETEYQLVLPDPTEDFLASA